MNKKDLKNFSYWKKPVEKDFVNKNLTVLEVATIKGRYNMDAPLRWVDRIMLNKKDLEQVKKKYCYNKK